MSNIIQKNIVPFDVRKTLVTFGKSISASRRARQITQQELAERAGVSRQTIIAIEKGSPEVAIGNYMSALWAMNLHESILASIETDVVAIKLMETELPKRVRKP